jgi:hypothetical protein
MNVFDDEARINGGSRGRGGVEFPHVIAKFFAPLDRFM